MQEVDGHGTQRVVLRDEQSGKHGWAASPAPVTLICCQVLGERGGGVTWGSITGGGNGSFKEKLSEKTLGVKPEKFSGHH